MHRIVKILKFPFLFLTNGALFTVKEIMNHEQKTTDTFTKINKLIDVKGKTSRLLVLRTVGGSVCSSLSFAVLTNK